MEPTPRQIALMRASLPLLAAASARTADRVCATLFRHAPSLRTSWAHTALSRSRRLLETVLEAAALIEQPARARCAVSLLAHDLRGQGVTPRDYVALHAALMAAIADQFGHGTEMEAAWAEVICAILAHMLADAHGPRRSALSLAA